jgi:poly(A) polymerase
LNDDSAASSNKLTPRIIPRSNHPISRSELSSNALRVLYRLRDAGFQAFLVGGCVRDIMLGLQPKDFDVATNALPEEVRGLFRNCRLVGRRFRLAHVVYGSDVIEVATFRASGAPAQSEEPAPEADSEADDRDYAPDEVDLEDEPAAAHRVLDAGGRILRDNIYGTVDDDVWRRDFTANALYYNIADFSVWDYVDGAADVAAKRLRLIGDPATRYREDPVRMLRAARFEAKLGFHLDAAGLRPIPELRALLANVPAARLFDEVIKLFLTGHGVESLRVLRHHGLLEIVLPSVEQALRRHAGGPVEQLLVAGLANTDERVRHNKPVTPVFLFALLLYGPIAAQIESFPPARWTEMQAIMECCDRALRQAHQRVTIPRRIAFGVRDMFALQPRLEHPRGKRAARLLDQPRFRAAYDLLLLRASLGLASREVADWWTQLQADGGQGSGGHGAESLPEPPAQPTMAPSGDGSPAPRRRRRGRRGGRRGGAPGASAE